MISILTGLPRSGKSYRAVWYIQNYFINEKSSIYNERQYLYTNIGGFKFDDVNNLLSSSAPLDPDKSVFFELNHHLVKDDDNFVKQSIYLDWDSFYKHLSKLHEMAKADKPDEELLKYARYHKLTPALFVIDEAYRFYSKKSDPVLVWWHGYHGHLGHDILIIIHRPSLMNSDYKVHTEEFIDAQPKSKALNNNTFRYFHYSDDKYTKEARYATDKLTASPDVFALYKSGDLHKPKKIIYKFIGYIIVALLFVFYIGYSFVSRTSDKLSDDHNISPSVQTNNNSFASSAPAPSFNSNSIFIRVRCDATLCTRIDPAIQIQYIPKLYFFDSLKSFDHSLIASSTVRIFDITYDDHLYSVSKDYLDALGVWSIPSSSNKQPNPPVNSIVGGNQ